MRVPFYDHSSEYAELRSGIESAILRVLARGQYEQGPEVEAFEGGFAVHLQVPHVASTGSCYDALCRGIQALGIGAGREVVQLRMRTSPAVRPFDEQAHTWSLRMAARQPTT